MRDITKLFSLHADCIPKQTEMQFQILVSASIYQLAVDEAHKGNKEFMFDGDDLYFGGHKVVKYDNTLPS